MRLYLSEKAARALKNLPPEDHVTCEQHGRQRYARTPRHHEEEHGSWLCGECLKGLEAADAEAKRAKRRQEDEDRDAKRAVRKAAKGATQEADTKLAEQLGRCKDANKAVRDTQHRLRERTKDLEFGEERIRRAEEALAAAQKEFEDATKALAAAQAEVPALEQSLEEARQGLDQLVVELQEQLDTADAAWRGVPPRHRKKRDRRTRHSAVQIVNANRRWHERQGTEAPVEKLVEAAEALAQEKGDDRPTPSEAGSGDVSDVSEASDVGQASDAGETETEAET